MWSLISAIFAAVIGFGAGAAGLTGNKKAPPTPVNTYDQKLCYNPETNVKVTLKWPDNFVKLADNRFTLNPSEFNLSSVGSNYRNRMTPGNPPTFNTDETTCKPMLFRSTDGDVMTARTYIRVRRNVRISSCKTDELAGPFNSDANKTPPMTCDNLYPFGPGPSAKDLRGSCAIDQYPDLRKVAETTIDGEKKEIFWVPFTHNARCLYDPNQPNCGPGTFASLREFIYVVNKKDGFDPLNPTRCKVKWDAGSTDKGACSHYFDVYMAEDLYKKVSGSTPVPADDPDYGSYDFYKQVIENCREQNIFLPTFDSPTGEYPPNFIEKPFVAKDFFSAQQNKILPKNNFELKNYQYFILSTPAINPLKTSLIKIQNGTTAFTITPCQEGQVKASAVQGSGQNLCYAPLGTIVFQKATNEYASFRVYSLPSAPQTFYFQDATGAGQNVYQFTLTEELQPQIKSHAPALQLNALEFMAENEWTWATPACKPAIYLYPAKETDLSVRLNIDGDLTDSVPPYDRENGWRVKAHPDGKIEQLNNGTISQYPYLYYEAAVRGVNVPKEGWSIERSKIKDQTSKILTGMGFNEKEIADFNEFWIPRLQDKPYYFVTLIPQDEVNAKEKLILSAAPDTLIRARFVFEGLDKPAQVEPLINIPSFKRRGFVVTDWGGAVVGKSCYDLNIK